MTLTQQISPAQRIRLIVLASVLGISVLAGWRIACLMLADAALADGHVTTALEWDGSHPQALLKKAEAQLVDNRLDEAATTARHLLQVEPTDGRAYRVLAQVAVAEAHPVQAMSLFRIAERRAPRDLTTRAWLAQHALEQGDSKSALIQIDRVLTLSPNSGSTVYPVLLSLAKDPGFADALAQVMQRHPPWRSGMLTALRQAGPEDQEAASNVMGSLQGKGGIDPAESEALIEALIRAGRWGEAYARWASPLVANGKPLPALFNANFALDPSGSGFDWRIPATPGVILDFEQGQGAARALHVRFLGRRVAGAFLEHSLLLGPGNYRLRFRERGDALGSQNGISWSVACATTPSLPLAESTPLNGSRQWVSAEMSFVVPSTGCEGQWLRLGNAGGLSIGQVVSGEAWMGALSIEGSPKSS